jgi:hypothetical protein
LALLLRRGRLQDAPPRGRKVIFQGPLYTIDFGLSGKELANSLPNKQLQTERPDNLELSGNK